MGGANPIGGGFINWRFGLLPTLGVRGEVLRSITCFLMTRLNDKQAVLFPDSPSAQIILEQKKVVVAVRPICPSCPEGF